MWMLAAWQGLQNDSISAGNTRLLMIFIGIVAFSMLVQAIVVIVAAVAATKTQKRVLVIAEEFRTRATPIIDKTEDIVEITLPKIRTISDNLLETSNIVRAKAQEFDATLSDANSRAKAQVARVDGMVSTALTATGTLAEMVHRNIRTPLLEMSGLVNGFKAGLDVLFRKSAPQTKPVAISRYEAD